MGNTFFFAWEPALMVWLQSHLGSFGIGLATVFSMFGEEMATILLLGLCYWGYNKELGKFIGRNACVIMVANPMIKNVFLRLRPYMVCPEVKCLKPVDPSGDIMDVAAQGYSFPSGHSSGSVVNFTSMALFLKKKWAVAVGVLIPLLVGVSRFCVGVHFPTDVLFGWALGLCVILLVPFFQKKFQKRWVFYLVLLLLMLPGWFYCKTNDYYTSFGMVIGFFAGDLFEERFVKFKNTTCWWKMILRVLGGGAVYFGLNTLLKLPFSSAFLSSGTTLAYLVRVLRYALILFVDVGVYPLVFDRFGKKQA
ncbi:MAG: phosphatase PAP2 family protein [Clostridia bacterium]|nr:phosphatase PAP2 family protein [Clostridia bacterium]